MVTNANRSELLQVADAVAREKSIDKHIVIGAMEEAIKRAARLRYGAETEIEVKINAGSGEIALSRLRTVVDVVEDYATEISLDRAITRHPEATIGDTIRDELPPLEFGRVAAQSAKQVIFQRVREAEKQKQYQEFKDSVGEIISGQVKRLEYGNVIVSVGNGEAIVKRDELIPREVFRYGDRLRAIIYDVCEDMRGPQVFLSRSKPEFLTMLFRQEVPEIYEGVVEIRAVARDPGSRAKMAVFSNDAAIDPVGACVGMRGSRVQAVISELQGEKIDIIPWSGNMASLVVSALAPANVTKVILDEDEKKIEVVVAEDQLSLTIGRRGQNVRLASQLTGWSIDILTEDEEAERRQKEFAERTQLFEDALDIDDMMAQLLATEGFSEVEDIAYVGIDELASIEGFDTEMAGELQQRALDYVKRNEVKQHEELESLGMDNAMAGIDGMQPDIMLALGRAGIKNIDDLADCSTDDLAGWSEDVDDKKQWHPGILEGHDLARGAIGDLIISARKAAGIITD